MGQKVFFSGLYQVIGVQISCKFLMNYTILQGNENCCEVN